MSSPLCGNFFFLPTNDLHVRSHFGYYTMSINRLIYKCPPPQQSCYVGGTTLNVYAKRPRIDSHTQMLVSE